VGVQSDSDRTRHGKGRMAVYVIILVIAAFIAYLAAFRDLSMFLVPSGSMEPTLYSRDYLITLAEDLYRRGDIVVIRDPADPKSFLVKRIVGLPSDRVEILGGALFINDQYASEPYVKEPMEFGFGPYTVPDGDVFVLGDNRNNSEDSVTWKRAVPASTIIGKVRFIYNPISRMGPVDSFPLTTTASS